ncbi:hypothetical protein [Streptomyces sp. NPDC001652]|uniref:effector-associated constant component EACC1 n=1 Tax=Streptomyces sp. NPDC001652 TaxID=3154393 RepID=UPI0033275295
MVPLIAEVGSVVASLIAASSFGAAIAAWFNRRLNKKPATTTVTIERDGKTIELPLDTIHDSDELRRIVAEIMRDSDVPDDGEPENQPPTAT